MFLAHLYQTLGYRLKIYADSDHIVYIIGRTTARLTSVI